VSELKERQLQEEISEMIRQLSLEEILDLLCVPEATDDLEDIVFDGYGDADEAAERDFIEGWIREESLYNAGLARAAGEMEAKQYV
jgi:hypothetical protein